MNPPEECYVNSGTLACGKFKQGIHPRLRYKSSQSPRKKIFLTHPPVDSYLKDKMAPKRQAGSNNTAASQYYPPATRSRRQAESTKKKTATFETGAVIMCLGSQTVRVDTKELRDRSGYFARFPENAFPKRFVLTPEDHAESICSLLFHPESVGNALARLVAL